MQRSIHNPWTWQDEFGYVQANEVSSATSTLYCAGQTSVNADGEPLHLDNMAEQIQTALDNLETVLSTAGFNLADIMRLNVFVTDMDAFFGGYEPFAKRLADAGCKYAGTLLEVRRLAVPGLLVELEATAQR